MTLTVGVVGCGLIGTRRARVAADLGHTVVAVADVDSARAQSSGARFGAEWTTEWRELVADGRIDALVVATYNRDLVPIAIATLQGGKHALCEKPMGRDAGEAETLHRVAGSAGRILKIGFTLRHHPAIARAHELAAGGAIGRLTAIRAAYGHGGRPGYDREWRADAELAGGGELLDQGVHVVDLCRWFLGEITEVSGMCATWFWEVAPLEDNGFALLRTKSGQVAALHTSWTQWRNLFRFEVLGTEGMLTVDGLGGSYGPERLTVARRRPEGGAPQEETLEFGDADQAWAREWEEFAAAIAEARPPLGNADDGLAAARIIDAIYKSSRTGGVVRP